MSMVDGTWADVMLMAHGWLMPEHPEPLEKSTPWHCDSQSQKHRLGLWNKINQGPSISKPLVVQKFFLCAENVRWLPKLVLPCSTTILLSMEPKECPLSALVVAMVEGHGRHSSATRAPSWWLAQGTAVKRWSTIWPSDFFWWTIVHWSMIQLESPYLWFLQDRKRKTTCLRMFPLETRHARAGKQKFTGCESSLLLVPTICQRGIMKSIPLSLNEWMDER